jgi:4-carboxymuconolactone decarboxylase
MSIQDGTTIDDTVAQALASLAIGDTALLAAASDLRDELQADSGLDAKTFSLVKIAALVAVDAPPASYLWQVRGALDAGATAAEIFGVAIAVAPQVGFPRVVAAAPEIMVALGLELPDGVDAPATEDSL